MCAEHTAHTTPGIQARARARAHTHTHTHTHTDPGVHAELPVQRRLAHDRRGARLREVRGGGGWRGTRHMARCVCACCASPKTETGRQARSKRRALARVGAQPAREPPAGRAPPGNRPIPGVSGARRCGTAPDPHVCVCACVRECVCVCVPNRPTPRIYTPVRPSARPSVPPPHRIAPRRARARARVFETAAGAR